MPCPWLWSSQQNPKVHDAKNGPLWLPEIELAPASSRSSVISLLVSGSDGQRQTCNGSGSKRLGPLAGSCHSDIRAFGHCGVRICDHCPTRLTPHCPPHHPRIYAHSEPEENPGLSEDRYTRIEFDSHVRNPAEYLR